MDLSPLGFESNALALRFLYLNFFCDFALLWRSISHSNTLFREAVIRVTKPTTIPVPTAEHINTTTGRFSDIGDRPPSNSSCKYPTLSPRLCLCSSRLWIGERRRWMIQSTLWALPSLPSGLCGLQCKGSFVGVVWSAASRNTVRIGIKVKWILKRWTLRQLILNK